MRRDRRIALTAIFMSGITSRKTPKFYLKQRLPRVSNRYEIPFIPFRFFKLLLSSDRSSYASKALIFVFVVSEQSPHISKIELALITMIQFSSFHVAGHLFLPNLCFCHFTVLQEILWLWDCSVLLVQVYFGGKFSESNQFLCDGLGRPLSGSCSISFMFRQRSMDLHGYPETNDMLTIINTF